MNVVTHNAVGLCAMSRRALHIDFVVANTMNRSSINQKNVLLMERRELIKGILATGVFPLLNKVNACESRAKCQFS